MIRQDTLWAAEPGSPRVDVAPGAVWLRGFFALGEQQTLTAEAMSFLAGPAGGYVPTVRGGGRMHVTMTCLGRHWNPLTYQYAATREDFDQAPVPPVPAAWQSAARRAAAAAGFAMTPDTCIINLYEDDGRMGLHQDKDESPSSIAAGVPVVSVSLGATGRFVFGGLKRRAPAGAFLLESGDAFVFGGPSRLCYHGVTRILPGTAPEELGIRGRINLTFRQF